MLRRAIEPRTSNLVALYLISTLCILKLFKEEIFRTLYQIGEWCATQNSLEENIEKNE